MSDVLLMGQVKRETAMLKTKHNVIHIKKHAGVYKKTVRMLGVVMFMVAIMGTVWRIPEESHAVGCPDVKVIFARGSGAERYTSGEYTTFKKSLEDKMRLSGLKYEIDDLDYPAVSIDALNGHLGTMLGAYVSGGQSYDFGDSVHKGTEELVRVINSDSCKETKYVFAGYSQGDIVILNALDRIDANRVIYIATFGDPKIFLPEGAGLVPQACSGKGLSDYRIYVPDCRAYKGILGAQEPYVHPAYSGKVGTWCNSFDILCSSHYSIKSHTSYVEDGLIEDASKFVYARIAKEFGIKDKYTSPHDTAILIDSTGSMSGLIDKYKEEATRLAKQTLESGGRVALYDYRDIDDDYVPVERCSFETCNMETFQAGLDAIETDGGGDEPESLLSASIHVMDSLNWKFGSTKSLVVLTDAGYHSPDKDGTTFYDVKKLSKEIDPVNFYIITEPENVEGYRELAEATDGEVVSSVDDLSILTDTIMERYDSLPRVEESDENTVNKPELVVEEVTKNEYGDVKVKFKSSGEKAMVFLNDAYLGVTELDSITFTELRDEEENVTTLVPLLEGVRGESVVVKLGGLGGVGNGGMINDVVNESGTLRSEGELSKGAVRTIVVPKAPNTGRR